MKYPRPAPSSFSTIGAFVTAASLAGLLGCQPGGGGDPDPGGSTGGKTSSATGGSAAGGPIGNASGGSSGNPSGGSGVSGGSGGSASGGSVGSGGVAGGALAGSGGTSASGGASGADSSGPSPSDGPPSTEPPATPASGAKTSEACGKGIMPPMDGIQNIDAANMKRRFFLRVPDSYDGKKAWPLVFAFHGAGNKDATWFDTNTGFRAENEAKAILIFPESLTNGGSHTWMTASQHPANLAFVDAMVDWAKKTLCIDPTRIFSTGQSSGAYFSQTMACQRGDLFRAVASNSGGERYFENCKGNPGVMLSYGKGDEASHTTAAQKATTFWVARKACKADAPMNVDPAPCVSYTGCKDGVPFVLCAHGGGHDWPGYANKGFWNFFDSFK